MMARHWAVDAMEARVFPIANVAERVMGTGPVAGCDACGGGRSIDGVVVFDGGLGG